MIAVKRLDTLSAALSLPLAVRGSARTSPDLRYIRWRRARDGPVSRSASRFSDAGSKRSCSTSESWTNDSEGEAMTQDEYVEALRDLVRGERESWIADARQRADEAGATGYVERQQRWLVEV